MAGAHLDSVPEGPGINDNGSGTAALLEIATRMGASPPVGQAVRFAWWGSEEEGLIGSTQYVEGLSEADRRAIAVYLNFDMVGSPNPGYLAYDGDNSDNVGAGPGPAGSGVVEQVLVDGLGAVGVRAEGTDFDGRSDYGPFIEAGIPSGGLFTGAEEIKTPEQAQLWGGAAGRPYDPCYHQRCDRLSNVDQAAFDRNLDAIAAGDRAVRRVAGRDPAAVAARLHDSVHTGDPPPSAGVREQQGVAVVEDDLDPHRGPGAVRSPPPLPRPATDPPSPGPPAARARPRRAAPGAASSRSGADGRISAPPAACRPTATGSGGTTAGEGAGSRPGQAGGGSGTGRRTGRRRIRLALLAPRHQADPFGRVPPAGEHGGDHAVRPEQRLRPHQGPARALVGLPDVAP